MDNFCSGDTIRLMLADGQSIDIKKRLNHGEQEDMFARWSPFIEADGQPARLERRAVRDSKVLAYLVGWSLTQNGGTPVPMSPALSDADRLATLANLDPDRFDEIHRAIETHETQQRALREAQKKILGGTPAAEAISALPSGADGASSGSVN